MKKLLIIINVDWFFISHRIGIAEAAKKEGWNVIVASEDTGQSQEIIDKGIEFVRIPLSRSGLNVFRELKLLYLIFRLYKRVKPDVVHQITLKPVIYGSIVSRFFRNVRVLNAISGLGFNFTGNRRNISQLIIRYLMKSGLNSSNTTLLFQNKDDYYDLKSLKVLKDKSKIEFIKGSGIDLEKFGFSPFIKKEKLNILFPARLLWDKGVMELYNATQILRNEFKGLIEFNIAGACDSENKAGVPESFIKKWTEDGYVVWHGNVKEILPLYQNSDIVVLPSYREGLPKSLIEACAVGRPIVTTKAPGCKECVDEGLNGITVPAMNAEKLAEALKQLILNEELRIKMGLYSRKKAEREFDIQNVIEKHLKIYSNILSSSDENIN